MKILALDIATSIGWAAFDTRSHESSIINGAHKLGKAFDQLSEEEKKKVKKADYRSALRNEAHILFSELYEAHMPDVVCLEQPLSFIGDWQAAKPKKKGSRKAPVLPGIDQVEASSEDKQGGGPNANTAFLLNQLFAVADEFFRVKCCQIIEAVPITWQTMTRPFPGKDNKEKSISFCETIGISLNASTKPARGDAADASVIAIWAQRKCQELKMRQRAAA